MKEINVFGYMLFTADCWKHKMSVLAAAAQKKWVTTHGIVMYICVAHTSRLQKGVLFQPASSVVFVTHI